jgi:hypothetical protein
MPRLCTVCLHPQLKAINAALVAGTSAVEIAAGYSDLSHDAIRRHGAAHLPKTMTKAKDARDVAQGDALLQQARALQGKATSLLLQAEKEGDFRTALAGVREARGCLELLAKMMGQINDAPTVNVIVNPQWLSLRAVIVETLVPFPDARIAVADALARIEAGADVSH